MDELDFSKAAPHPEVARPAQSPIYNAAVAMEFFRGIGKSEELPPGGTLFSENDKISGLFSKNDKMYLLLEGEVNLFAGNKVIGSVKVGEIFGEMAALTQLPRSATAAAKTKCRIMSIDGKNFQTGIQRKPEFALMLLSIMIQRLRQTTASLRSRNAIGVGDLSRATSVFDKKLMAGLAQLTREREPVRFAGGRVIMKEGDTGVLMFIVLQGTVAISIQAKVVERVGPGGIFGEMALVDQSPRGATATAENDCELLGLNRNDLLALVKSSPAFGMSLLKALADRLIFMTSHFR